MIVNLTIISVSLNQILGTIFITQIANLIKFCYPSISIQVSYNDPVITSFLMLFLYTGCSI